MYNGRKCEVNNNNNNILQLISQTINDNNTAIYTHNTINNDIINDDKNEEDNGSDDNNGDENNDSELEFSDDLDFEDTDEDIFGEDEIKVNELEVIPDDEMIYKDEIYIDDLLDRLMFSKKELLKMANNKSQSESLKYIITNNLKKLDVYDRPIHCSDLEKKDFFIKNKNIWKKDDGGEEIGRFIEKVNQNGIKSVMKCMQENKFNDDDLVKTEKVIKYLTTEPIPGKRELVENIAENTHIDLNDNCDLKNKIDLKIGD